MNSLLNPDARDRYDAYGYPEHNEMYRERLREREVKWKFENVEVFDQSDERTDDMEFRYGVDFGVRNWDWVGLLALLASLTEVTELPIDLKSLADLAAKLSELATTLTQQATDSTLSSDLSKDLTPSLPASLTLKVKLLLLARHGEGYHNVANAKYRDQWASKYRFLGTDGTITWGPDAKLTDLGKAQAAENNLILKRQVARGMPIPTKFIVSPLLRSIETMVREWDGIDIPRPIVNEKVRETIGINICHQRSSKTELSKFPIDFPDDFTEEDEIFKSFSAREEFYEQFLRVNDFLQELFEEDDEVVSVTCHAGTIRAFLTVIGHRPFTICTGGMIPVVIRASTTEGGADKS